jgi:hypothetical protein
VTNILEVRPTSCNHQWGVYHVGQDRLIASFSAEIDAYRYALGYQNSLVKNLSKLCEHLEHALRLKKTL